MNDPRLLALSERLNKYVGLIRAENPNMNEKDIVDKAATLALTEQKTFEAKMGMKVSDAVADRFGDGTMIDRAEDDNIWQQGKGSKISEDGFHKKNHSTITMPKDIDVHTSEGNRKAGKFVEELKTAKKREDKMRQAAENQAWENRKIQVTVDKKENS